jgi:translation elongation factor P/translation initiation factor 5A
MKIIGSAIRTGNIIEVDGRVYQVVKHNIVQPGKGGAFNQIDMRDIKTGTKTNMKFRSDEAAELLRVDEKELQYLYHEGDQYTFMDQESYEQVAVNRDLLGDAADFLVDNMMVTMDFLEGGGPRVHRRARQARRLRDAAFGDILGVRLPRVRRSDDVLLQARDVLAGRTISGHPVREAAELLNYRGATAWLIDQLRVLDCLRHLLAPGRQRVLPVRLSQFTITEEAYDVNLNPTRAKVGLGMRVLSYNDLSITNPGYALFLAHQVVKETMATLNSATSLPQLAGTVSLGAGSRG